MRAGIALLGVTLTILGTVLSGNIGIHPFLRVFLNDRTSRPPPAFAQVELVANGSAKPRGAILSERGIYFLPLADFPQDLLTDLRRDLADSWGMESHLLDALSIERSARPPGNTQLDAFDLVDQVARAYQTRGGGRTVIGFTTHDIRVYSIGDFWNFGAVNPSGHAVISTARMDPRSFGQSSNDKLLMERLAKLTVRYIGATYHQLGYSTNPESVMYQPIRSQLDLDRMTEWPCPGTPGEWVTC